MRLCIFVATLAVSLAGTTVAQSPVTLTLDKSVELALEKNTTVIQAQNTLDARQSAVTAAVGNLLPSLSFSGSYFNRRQWQPVTGRGSQFVPGIGLIDLGQSGGFSLSESYSTGLSSQMVLFNGFANYAEVRRAKADASFSDYSYDRTMQNTVLQTNQLFLNVVFTYELLKVNDDNLKRDQRQLDRIVESNKVGAVAIADVYRQQVQVGSDELALIQAQSNHEKAKADLVAYLGTDFDSEYSFDFSGIPTDIDTTEFAPLNTQYSNFNELVNSAKGRRPDYLSSVENLNSAEAGLSEARAAYFPTISATGNYGYSAGEFKSLTDNRSLSIGLNISLPIFNGFATQNTIEQQSMARNNADEQTKQAERQLRVDIRKALLDLESAEKQVKVTQTSVRSAEMDRQIAEEKYNLGAGTLLDLLVATANYTNALSNKLSAATQYLLAKKGVEFALGTISK